MSNALLSKTEKHSHNKMSGGHFKDKGSNITPMQKEQLILFIAENHGTLFSRKKNDDLIKTNLWKHLTLKLNSMGSNKNPDGWRRCIIGLKAVTKAKFKKLENELGSRHAYLRLTELESIILKMCDVDMNRPTSEDASGMFNMVSGTSTHDVETLDPSHINFGTVEVGGLFDLGNHVQSVTASSTITSGAYELGEASNRKIDSVRTSNVSQQQQSLEVTENRLPETQNERNEGLESLSQREIGVSRRSSNNQLVVTNETVQIDAPNRPTQQRSSINASQKEGLVKFVSDNYSALFGRISTQLNSDLLKKKLWCLITNKLNGMGSNKNIQGWKDYFSTVKGLTKEKLTLIRQNRNRTNGAFPENVHLTEIDIQIIEMFKHEILDGSSILAEIGLSRSSNEIINSTANRIPNQLLQGPIRTISRERDGTTAISPQRNSSQEITSDLTVVSPQRSFSQDLRGVESSNGVYPQQPSQKRLHTSNHSQSHNKQIQNQPKRLRISPLHLPQTQPTRFRSYSPQDQQSFQPPQSSSQDQQSFQPPQSPPRHNQSPQNQSPYAELNDEEIRIIQEPRPQRRGIEVNLNRYVEPCRQRQNDNDENETIPRSPRRNRLSVPLGVMATESLQLQRANNALLADLLRELRITNRH